MSTMNRFIEAVSLGISLLGTLVVAWGIVEAMYGFVRAKFMGASRATVADYMRLRQELGSHLLLGLEIFIAADIIISVASPTWNRVGILGAIVAIRTVLSYFLTREVARGPDAETVTES